MNENVEKDVREIKYKVDAIEKSVDLLVRANRQSILDDLLSFFGKSQERVRVFLAVDGERSVGQIAASLALKPQNVSRRISELEREGLISVKSTDGSIKTYEKTEKVRLLGLERQLEQRLQNREPQTSPEVEDGDTPRVEDQV